MVTARAQEHERIQGFELGADDYVVKPFVVKELMLRIKAVLRRMDADTRAREYKLWLKAVDRTMGWLEDEE